MKQNKPLWEKFGKLTYSSLSQKNIWQTNKTNEILILIAKWFLGGCLEEYSQLRISLW